MLKTRYIFILLGMLSYPMASSAAQLSIGIGFPNASIGINLGSYPNLVRVPGYPVYYAPGLEANFFFYDSRYWVYQDDEWYCSSWYNGPWDLVDPEFVPEFVLRIPVRYYRRPPTYFQGWRSDAPPRWGDHWGRDWEQRRSGWDKWNRRTAPAPAPLPVYQRQYSGDRYPQQVERQRELQQKNYRYQPRDPVVRQHDEERPVQQMPSPHGGVPQGRPVMPEDRGVRRQDTQQPVPHRMDAPIAPRPRPPERSGEEVQKSTIVLPPHGRSEVQDRRQPPQPGVEQRTPQQPRSQNREEKGQGRDAKEMPRQDQGQDQERGRNRKD